MGDELKTSLTQRGFGLIEFTDRYGVKCSLQESSFAVFDDDPPDSHCVWFGCSELGLKEFKAGEGWKEHKLENTIEHYWSANTRMHLTQAMVKALLPALQHFAETGVLPVPDESKQFADNLTGDPLADALLRDALDDEQEKPS